MMCCPVQSTHTLTMPHMPWNPAMQTWHLADDNKRRELWVNIQPCFLNKLYSPWFPFQYCVYNRASTGVFDSEQVQAKGGFISRCIMLSQQPRNGLSFNLNRITYIFTLMVAIMTVWAGIYWCLLIAISLVEDVLSCIIVVWKWLWSQCSQKPYDTADVQMSVISNISHYSRGYLKNIWFVCLLITQEYRIYKNMRNSKGIPLFPYIKSYDM